jgi:glucosamine--fructose-6-phosphate aminotransferase (isomerizing)
MHDAIYAQPGALRLVTRGQDAAIAAAAAALRGTAQALLCGTGTSWHAALLGELLLARVGGLGYRARALAAATLVQDWPAPEAPTGVVVVSHRGGQRDAAEALVRARASGGASVAITGRGSDGLDGADVVLRTVDQEGSAAHTVSYTAALALLAHLAAAVGRDEAFPREVDALPDHMALLLGQEAWEDLARRFAGRRRYWFVGGGPNAVTAWEAALKLTEAAYLTASGHDCEGFLHGPRAALEPQDLVVLIAPPGPSRARGLDVARFVKAIGATLVALVAEDDREVGALAAETIALPLVHELLSPILAIVPLQLLTYHLALAAGTNPDTMRTDQPAHGRARSGLAR